MNWTESEGPGESQYADLDPDKEVRHLFQAKPPSPDPFEEAWAEASRDVFDADKTTNRQFARYFWDAAVKHMAAADDGLEGLDDTQKLVFKIVRQLADEIKNRDKLKHMEGKG